MCTADPAHLGVVTGMLMGVDKGEGELGAL